MELLTWLQNLIHVLTALAMPGHSQMVLFLPLLYSFAVSAANGVLKSTGIFHNDISHLCNEISFNLSQCCMQNDLYLIVIMTKTNCINFYRNRVSVLSAVFYFLFQSCFFNHSVTLDGIIEACLNMINVLDGESWLIDTMYSNYFDAYMMRRKGLCNVLIVHTSSTYTVNGDVTESNAFRIAGLLWDDWCSVFFYDCMNKLLNKQSSCRWF